MTSYAEKAKILVDALPYIKRLNSKTIVIKYGGSALTDPVIKDTIINNIALMKLVGMKPVLVHGGGPEINTMLGRLDVKSEFIGGLRITSNEAMEIVEMVLSGKVNKSIVSDIETKGVRAIGISGKDGGTIKARKLIKNGVDYGQVGEVDCIDTSLICSLINNDFIPVIAPVGQDDAGNTYNINADYVIDDPELAQRGAVTAPAQQGLRRRAHGPPAEYVQIVVRPEVRPPSTRLSTFRELCRRSSGALRIFSYRLLCLS